MARSPGAPTGPLPGPPPGLLTDVFAGDCGLPGGFPGSDDGPRACPGSQWGARSVRLYVAVGLSSAFIRPLHRLSLASSSPSSRFGDALAAPACVPAPCCCCRPGSDLGRLPPEPPLPWLRPPWLPGLPLGAPSLGLGRLSPLGLGLGRLSPPSFCGLGRLVPPLFPPR